MNNPQNIGRLLIYIALIIGIVGVLMYFFGSYFRWLGNLPGDFRLEGDNYTIYFPLSTMIIISLILNLLWRVFRNLLN